VRIVFLNPSSSLGGAERCLLDIFASLRRADPGIELHLLVTGDGPLQGQAAAVGATVHTLHLPVAVARWGDSGLVRNGAVVDRLNWAGGGLAAGCAVPGFVRQLRRTLQNLRPDLVHSNGIKTHLLTALGSPARVPVVWHLHDFYGQRPAVPYILRALRRRVALGIAVSRAVARDAVACMGGLPVEVVPNAVDLERFAPGPGDGPLLDQLAGLPSAGPETVRIGLVATYALWKGHSLFLEACGRVAAEVAAPPTRFYVIGGPIYRTQAQHTEGALRARAGALGLAGRVGFIGFQVDPTPIYRALDIVVHASTSPEPFGLTIAEAMACGRAVIVSQAGGAAELFTPEVHALGVPPGDAGALAAAIRRLAVDGELRARLGERARLTAVERFDSRRLGPQVLAVYERLLGGLARVAALSGRARRE
jgi:glycosyltransferase involved in cell wall biosynthesis